MSKRGSGSSARAGSGFTKGQKQAINDIETKLRKQYNVVGEVNFKKEGSEKIRLTYTTKETHRRPVIGKMINPENYDVIERTTVNAKILLISPDGKERYMHTDFENSKSTDNLISRHRVYTRRKRKT